MNRNGRTIGKRSAVLAAAVVSVIGMARPAGAASYTWTSLTSGNWSAAGNWSGGAPPVGGSSTTDISFFPTGPNAFPKNVTVTVTATDDQTGGGTGGTFTLYSLDLGGNEENGSGSANVTIDGASLNFVNGASGNAQVNLNATAGGGPMNYTVANNLTLSNDTAFQGNGSAGFTFSGVIGGTGALNKTGTSTLVLSGANTFSGPTTVGTGGQITLLNANALQNSTLNYVNAGGTVSFDGQAAVTLGGLSGNKNISLSSTAGGVFALSVGNNNSSTTYSGVLSNTGSLAKVGTGTLTLSGANTYTGPTKIAGGTLSVDSLANGGSASGIGQSSNAASNLVIDGGTLQYTGSAVNTNRQITVGTGGGAIDASGSGAVNFTSTAALALSGTNAARTLTLTGTNAGANTLAAVIGNNGTGATGVTKSGAGTWLLTGNNTYTGDTNITGGTLNVTGSGSINTSTVVNLNGGSLTLANPLTRGSGQTLKGQGSVTGGASVNNGATVQVGQTHGTAGTAQTLAVSGNTIFASGSALSLDLFGAGSADKFTTGTLTLNGGTLNVANASGFTFSAGQSWDLIDWTTLNKTANFSLNLPALGSGLTWNQSQLYNTGVLSIDAVFTTGHYTLSLSPASSRVISGGTTALTATINNVGNGTADSVAYSNLRATDATATITGSTGSGTLAQTQSGSAGQTFSSTVTGVHTVTPMATVNNANLGGGAASDGTTTASVTVVDKRTVTGGTVNLGKIIAGTSVNTTASVSTTGDNDHYTGVQVAGSSSNTGNGLSASGSATNFTATGSALRTISGAITGAGIVSGDLLLNVTTLENGGAGLAGEGTYAQVGLHYTADVYSHADAQFATGTFAASYDPAHSPPYSNGTGDANYTPVAPSQTLSDGNHTLNIDFGTIWATPYDNPYPVYAYFDITNPLSFAVTVAMTGLTGGATVTPAGTSPTWALQAADGGTFNVASLAAGGVYHARVLFNTNDPGLYLPGSPFKAAWDISLLEDQSVAGAYTTAHVLHVNATAVAVPLPASSLAGVGLLGGLGMMRIARSRRSRAEQLV